MATVDMYSGHHGYASTLSGTVRRCSQRTVTKAVELEVRARVLYKRWRLHDPRTRTVAIASARVHGEPAVPSPTPGTASGRTCSTSVAPSQRGSCGWGLGTLVGGWVTRDPMWV